MHVEPRHTIEELELHAKKEKTARVALRIRSVILAMRGREAEVIAQTLGRLAPRSAGIDPLVQRGRARSAPRRAAARPAQEAHARAGGRADGLARAWA